MTLGAKLMFLLVKCIKNLCFVLPVIAFQLQLTQHLLLRKKNKQAPDNRLQRLKGRARWSSVTKNMSSVKSCLLGGCHLSQSCRWIVEESG